MHAGIHVLIDADREFVAEQLVGGLNLDFGNGLNWTPLEKFRERDRGGCDVTVPATDFRGVDEACADDTIPRLNAIEGHPFIGEDCTAFIERGFGARRMFADSPLLRSLSLGVRIGDPALPLLKPDAAVDPQARKSLRFDTVRSLPDARAGVGSLNARIWFVRGLFSLVLALTIGQVLRRFLRADRYARLANS